MKETDKAWVGAMLDSRAYIRTKNNKQRAAGSEQIVLVLRTKHGEVAQRLCAMTGTAPSLLEQKKVTPEVMRRQCIEHCPEAHVHMDTLAALPMITTWTVTGASAAIVLWNVRKYMVTTREPWDWAMGQSFKQMKVTGQGATATIRAIRRLHGLGWKIPPPLDRLVPQELEAAK